ncbi:hypothetical protein [Klebsiella pneumoniae]|uniref:hypothetical protein n=1 Tax=Klebsiella pneumoniae TaxID=573 RepID=UPI002F968BBB
MTEIPEPLKVYQTIAEFANRQGVLDQKTQELISLAVAAVVYSSHVMEAINQ